MSNKINKFKKMGEMEHIKTTSIKDCFKNIWWDIDHNRVVFQF